MPFVQLVFKVHLQLLKFILGSYHNFNIYHVLMSHVEHDFVGHDFVELLHFLKFQTQNFYILYTKW